MKRSPLQLRNLSPEMQKFAVEAKMMAHLIEVHQDFISGIEELKEQGEHTKELAKSIQNYLSQIKKLPKGDRGESIIGPRGIQGKPGKDAEPVDIMEIAMLAASLIPRKVEEPEVENPEDEEEEMKEIIARVQEALGIDEKWKKMTNEMASYRNQLAGKVYGRDTWARGGGGSSGGTSVSIETPAGAVNAVNTTYTVTATPLWVTADGIQYFEGAGYSIVGLTITMDVPPSQYIRAAIES